MTRAQRQILLGSLALLGILLVFLLPYRFPPAVETISASYDYGFNNSVGILLLCIVALIFVGAGFLAAPGTSRVRLLAPVTGQAVNQRDMVWGTVVSVLTVWLAAGLSGPFGYSESMQFVQAMERLQAGQVPYLDFDFYYGPLLAYVPYIFQLAGNAIGISQKNAYFVVLLVLQLIGLWELKYLLNAVELPGRWRRWAFWAVALATLPFHSGINLVLLRYITPLVAFLYLRQIQEGPAHRTALATALLVLLTFGISVEYGAVFTLTVSVYHGGRWLMERQSGALLALVAALLMPVLFRLAFPGLFQTVQLYLMGAWRWPFVPSPALALFFGAVLVLAYAAGQHLRELRQHFFFLSFCLLAFGSLPAALGRCDPGHVLLNGLGILLLAFVALVGQAQPRVARLAGGALLLVFVVLFNLGCLLATKGYYSSLAFRMVVRNVPAEQLHNLVGTAARLMHKDPAFIEDKIAKTGLQGTPGPWPLLDNIGQVAAPYALSEPLALHLRETGKLQTLYFKDYAIVASGPEVQWAIRDLDTRRPQHLLLPLQWQDVTKAQDYGPLLNQLFTSVYSRTPFRNGNALLTPLVAHILAHYEVVGSDDAVVLMRRRAD